MRETHNILDAAELRPDLIGFIFYCKSPRYAVGQLDPEITAKLPGEIRKAGVFVNADYKEITGIVRRFSLDIVQLHGNETPDLCQLIMEKGIPVIKAFNIRESVDFKLCTAFMPYTEYFLFDTSTSGHGGSGMKFDWKILEDYDQSHPFFLSGGIASLDVKNIFEITNPSFYGIDLNSRFEIKPGLKDIKTLKTFISDIRLNKN